jgi:hypothetical protein
MQEGPRPSDGPSMAVLEGQQWLRGSDNSGEDHGEDHGEDGGGRQWG